MRRREGHALRESEKLAGYQKAYAVGFYCAKQSLQEVIGWGLFLAYNLRAYSCGRRDR